jgi:dipeptide transport system substrate-binding protein
MSMPALLASVAKVDDATVKITLTRRDPAFLADLAMDFASILSKEYADTLLKAKRRDDLNRMPIGTGPYQFVGYQPDVRINYRANPDYWRGAQPVAQLAFLISPDAGARLKAFKDGDCQVMADPAGADIATLKQDSAVNVMQAEALDVAYLAYNTSQKPFDDVRVRTALNQAIDRKAIVDAVYGGQAAVARSPLPASMWGHIDALPDAAPDPEAAKAALAAAGVTNLSLKLWVPPVDRSYNPAPRKMADLIKADLAKAGVTVEVVTDSLGAFIKTTASPGRDGAVLFGWTSDNGDPDNILGTLLGCDTVGIANRAQWCDVDFNKAILDARMVEDPAARTSLYEAAQKTFAAQAPWLTTAHSLVTVPVAKVVKNYVVDPFGHHNFEGVDLAD